MNTKEQAAAIRAEYKRKYGWTARDISVRIDLYSMGSSIDVRIKNPSVNFEVAKQIAKGAESISRCEISGEILSGGNRYVSVSYSHEAADVIKARYADVLNDAAAKLIVPVRPTRRVVVGSSIGWTGSTGSLLASRNRSHGTTSPMP